MKSLDQSRLVQVTNQRYRQHYHVMTPAGWMNDPNGLCYFQGYYHLFYQWNPYSADWGLMHWGHYRSKDLIHWEQLPVALVPGDPEDSGGCFSGSAIVKNGRLYLIYTGHHYYDDGDLDHFWENQNMAYSDDGIHFTKYKGNPIISAPKDNTQHFRDPKVWEHDGHYYLVLGSQDAKSMSGRILLYQSDDLLHWKYRGPIAHATDADSEGFMWECPDFFHLNGKDVLVCSPQGIKATEHRFLNKDDTAYFCGSFDYQQGTYQRDAFREVDNGHNFYAPQSFLAPDGRRIQFGWMSSFDDPMPEKADGWAGCLTVPRELVVVGHHLGAVPINELKELRQKQTIDQQVTIKSTVDLSAHDRHQEMLVSFKVPDDGQVSWSCQDSQHRLVTLTYDQHFGVVTVTQAGKANDRYAAVGHLDQLDLQIFVDSSSVEFFVNHGAATFTERYFTEDPLNYQLAASRPTRANVTAYQLSGEE